MKVEMGKVGNNVFLKDHHRRYFIAWSLHQDPFCTNESRIILEKEMDEAQNNFGWNEFQEFKKTLPGFVEYWKAIRKNFNSLVTKGSI